MDTEIFRFFVAYHYVKRDDFGKMRSGLGRTTVVMDHDIRCIDDVMEIEDIIAREVGNQSVILQYWKRFADMPAQEDCG